MAKYVILSVLLVFAAVNSKAGAAPAEVTATITPMRESYHLGEPLAVALAVKNDGRASFTVPVGYLSRDPFTVGLRFTVPPGVKQLRYNANAGDFVVPVRTLAPGHELRRVIALNRYLQFGATGRHSIEFTTEFQGSPPASGKVVIDIQPGAVDEKWIRGLIAIVQGHENRAPPGTAHAGGALSKEEATELLIWADSPLVIEPLIAAVKDRNAWGLGGDIIRSLRKFFTRYDRARSGILEVAAATGAVRDAIAVFGAEGKIIPSEYFKPIFASKSIMNIWPSLEYIRAHGTRDDIEAVEPLVNNDFSPPIAQLAAAVVKDLKTRPSAKSPAAPGQEKK